MWWSTVLLGFAALCVSAQHRGCQEVRFPVDSSLMRKEVSRSGCSRGGSFFETRVRVLPWGIIFVGLNGPNKCTEEITLVFRKRDRPAEIFWKPEAGPFFFRNIAPDVFRRYQQCFGKRFPNRPKSCGFAGSITYNWPCHKVPWQSVIVWGPRRKLFISLITKMVRGVRNIRDGDDCRYPGAPPTFRVPLSYVAQKQFEARITTAALTLLTKVAYENFFCIA